MKCLKLFVLLGALTTPGWAQDAGEAPEQGVARVSVVSGEVTVRRGDSGEYVAAELNAPLVSLDHLLTEIDSRAEIQLDWANFIRLAPESEVSLAELKDRDFLIQVSGGTATFRVLRDSNSQLEISTPTLAVRPRQPGTYRVTVRDDGSTLVTVRAGEAEIFAGGTTDILRAGQTLLVTDPANPQRFLTAAIGRDEWDRWNESRDKDLERSNSYQYVSRDIYGVEALNGYGRWVYDAPYGWVWVPSVAVDWAPYRVGRWTWVNYYGWTWVSGDPWGWAPYHHGRWYYASRYGWVWYPGEIRVRNYWRPALVAFFGWGTNLGWVALAPYEVYRPWYGPGRTIVNNVTYVTNVNVIGNYKNARFISGRSGVTSVVHNDFGRRNITINNYVVARDRDLRQGSDAGRWLSNEPSREHRQFSDRQVSKRVTSRPAPPRDFVSSRPDRVRRDNNRPIPNGPDNTRRVDASPRPDPDRGNRAPNAARQDGPPRNGNVVESPRNNPGNDQGRGRPQQQEASRQDNPRRPESPQQNADVTFPGRDSEPQRGRPQQQETSRQDDARRPEPPQQNAVVTFPGRDPQPQRGREPETQDRGQDRGRPQQQEASRPDNARRPEPPQQNPVVTFPGRDPQAQRGRPQQEANRQGNARPSESRQSPQPPQPNAPVAFPGRDQQQQRARQQESGRDRGELTVANGRENPRRPDAPTTNASVTFPQTAPDRGRGVNGGNVATRPAPPQREPEQVRQPEPEQRRAEAPQRREPEVARTNPNPEPTRPGRFPSASDAEVQRPPEPQRPGRFPSGASSEVQRPQEPSRPGRFPSPEREQPREQAPAPQTSAPSSSPAPAPSQGNDSGGGRGRGRR